MKTAYIDLGAFDGDTIELALTKYPNLDAVYAFEPLAENFAALNRKFGGNDKIHLLQCAADVKNGESVLYCGNFEIRINSWKPVSGHVVGELQRIRKDRND